MKTNCPDLSLAIYADGEKILKHKIKASTVEEKKTLIEDLIALWKDRDQYFANKTPKGEYLAKSCQLQYDHKGELGKSKEELYKCFDKVFKTDKTTFTHPKSLYSYFSLSVHMYEEGKKPAAELFNTYDEVSEKIEVEIQNYSEKLNEILSKQESGKTLNRKEVKAKDVCESYLKNYKLIQQNIEALSVSKSTCNILIPLYSKSFETHQNDSIWLKRSVNRMYHKECTEDVLYEQLVKQYDKVSPSADTKIFVATILFKKGKDAEAYKYLKEAYELEKDAYEKSNLAYRIGVILKKKGQYSQARTYFLNALKLNPSNGKPHLAIADMYDDSAKNCGKDNFYKRAVYWLAAKEAKKASVKDPTLQKRVNQSVDYYEAKAPTRKEIFQMDMSGKRIDIGCWIQSYIIVPKL
ncbi:tetratricopeptide repeat protein [Winogradskyella sp. 3972H.M.0a.05]|uniref:tetratricopeptide repeat protein n=1 Tax=Winogradskyella sp. 3972H.M.0a.05 TaxID=2950277 RepID=UPI003397C2C8